MKSLPLECSVAHILLYKVCNANHLATAKHLCSSNSGGFTNPKLIHAPTRGIFRGNHASHCTGQDQRAFGNKKRGGLAFSATCPEPSHPDF